MSEHTKGPWKIAPTKHRNGVPTVEIQHGDADEVVCTMESADNPADARLVAAAPDLLATLREIALMDPHDIGEAWDEWGEAACYTRMRQLANDALAKTEGR